MKKFWEKHDLFKVAGIMVIITVLLTWVIPGGYFSGTELTINDITRVGIFDFFTYGLLGMYYFTVLVTFMFVLGGFYQVLSKTGGYQKLTDSIAKNWKGKEIIFVLIVSFVIAALTSVMNEYFVLLAFIPFIITIISKMKLDRITGFVATFGSILVGTIGSIYSDKIVGMNVSQLGIGYGDYIWVKLIIFGVAFIGFSVFTVLNIRKVQKAKKVNEIEDLFVSEAVTKKNKVWPLVIILSIFAIVAILAYLPWESVFKTTIFTDLTAAINEFEILESTVFAYILGTISAFGSWDVFGVQVLMLIAAVIIKWTYKIETNEFYTAFGEGLKKSGKLVVLMLMSYLILEFTVMYPVIPVIVDWIMNLTSKFNVILGIIASSFASLFSVEYQYLINLAGSYFTVTYADFAKQLAIMMQSTFGLASMITPASAILLIGLSYLGISYKEWFKYIWKFLLLMFVALVVIMLIIF